MKNSVRIILSAAECSLEVTFAGHTNKVDITELSKSDRSELIQALWEWSSRGFIGYPQLDKVRRRA